MCDDSVGKLITSKETNFVATRLIRDGVGIRVGYMFFKKGDRVEFHEASVDQLFLVINGEGWVAGTDRDSVEIHKGEAAFWKQGEMHEAGTEKGMEVICIEGKNLDEYNTPVLQFDK